MQETPKFNLNVSLIEKLPSDFNGKVHEVNLKLNTIEKIQGVIKKFTPIPITLDFSEPILLDARINAYGFNIQAYLKVGEKNE